MKTKKDFVPKPPIYDKRKGNVRICIWKNEGDNYAKIKIIVYTRIDGGKYLSFFFHSYDLEDLKYLLSEIEN
jgi:hypothetical protein